MKITITAKYLAAYGSRVQLTGLQSGGAKRTKSAGVMNNSEQRDAYNKNPQLQFGSDPSLDMDTLSCQHLLYITQHFISAEKKKP